MKIGGFTNLFEKTLVFFAIGFVLFPKFAPLFFILLITVVLSGIIKKEVSFQLNVISSLFLLFYFCYLIGIIFTRDINAGVFELEKKLSFVIFPLLLSLKFKKIWSINVAYMGFILATFLVTLYGIIMALSAWLGAGGGNWVYFSSAISPIHHPSYLAAYLTISTAFAFIGWREKLPFFSLYWIIPFTIFVIVIHGFLQSLSGTLFLLIAIFTSLLIWLRNKFRRPIFYTIIILMPIIGFIVINSIPSVQNDWKDASSNIIEYSKNPKSFVENREQTLSSSSVRIILWTAAFQIFYKHPFGVGTGNMDEFMEKELIILKQKELTKQNFNPHNQFLQTAVEIGFFGLLVFFAILFSSIYYGLKYKNYLLIIISSNLIFNSLFESMLQRQSGIIFYCFWLCLLSLYLFTHQIKKVKIS
ncbi:MAG: O-antigen ligase family protein [Flavobacteriia bacterium]|nr:O-antigen ligase family protein [Flavobacteriia bacterium]